MRREGEREQPIQDGYDFLYSAGVSSLVEVPMNGFTVGFGARMGWAEQIPLGGGGGQGFATLQTGVEVRRPLGINIKGRQLDLAGSFIYYYFFPAAEFTNADQSPIQISNQYEFGATIGLVDSTELWFFDKGSVTVLVTD